MYSAYADLNSHFRVPALREYKQFDLTQQKDQAKQDTLQTVPKATTGCAVVMTFFVTQICPFNV